MQTFHSVKSRILVAVFAIIRSKANLQFDRVAGLGLLLLVGIVVSKLFPVLRIQLSELPRYSLILGILFKADSPAASALRL